MSLSRHAAVADWDGNPAPEAPLPPESLKESGLTLGVHLRHAAAHHLHPRRACSAATWPVPVPAVQGDPRAAQVPQGREVHPGGRRRPGRRGELPVQPDRPGPPAGAGRDRSSAPTSARPRCRWRTTSSSATGRRSPACSATRRRCEAPFGHLVLKEEMFNAIGPAIISGRSVFIYGPPGNGKTAMARAIGDFMNTAGGVDLRPVRVRRRRQHHHRVRPVAARHRRHRRRVRRRRRRDRPPAALDRGGRPAVGAHPPARSS